MNYIGLDIHARNFSISAMDQDNQILFEHSFPTSAANLRKAVGAIAGPKQVVLEESTIAAWAFRVLHDHAQQVVVADPVRNRWISKDENINDQSAARKLVQLLRGGLIHPVHHSEQQRQAFKELVLAYHDTSREAVRFKNKVKAKFRQHGISPSGQAVYTVSNREQWLAKLEVPLVRIQAGLLLNSVDHFSEQKQRLREQIAARGRQFPQIRRFRELPGVGLVRAATFFALVDTPHRFANKRKLWSYCGISVVNRQSDQMKGPVHLTRRGNRLLKEVAKGAAITAISNSNNQFRRQYRRLLAKGIKAENARLTVARALVATMWAMWRKDESFIPRD